MKLIEQQVNSITEEEEEELDPNTLLTFQLIKLMVLTFSCLIEFSHFNLRVASKYLCYRIQSRKVARFINPVLQSIIYRPISTTLSKIYISSDRMEF